MRKKRTSGGLPRILRQGAALFTGAAALWLVWLTGDPAAALASLADSTQVATALLSAELDFSPQDNGQLSALDRLVLAQSSLLGGILPQEELTAPQQPSAQPTPEPTPPARRERPAPARRH